MLFLLLITGCQREAKQNLSPSNYKPTVVPEIVARTIAQRIPPNYFILEHNQASAQRTSGFPISNRTISRSQTINDESGIAALYVYNYADSGFVVISAELKHEPICAYVDRGSVVQYDSVPGPLLEWFGKTVENIQLLRDGSYANGNRGASAWWKLSQETQLSDYPDVARLAPIGDPDDGGGGGGCGNGSTTIVRPLLPVTWGQGCSYNDLCPNKGCTNICFGSQKAWTGCVATSMGQIIRYWSPVSRYNYNYATMPNDFGNAEVQRLMKDAGTAVQMNYGCSGSSAYGQSVPNALVGGFYSYAPGFGFSSATRGSYTSSSYLTVKNNLNNGWPVLLEGCASRRKVWLFFWKYSDCHEWVCDGYNQSENSCYSYLYFHMNWGWHETWDNTDFNGWFAFDNWNIPGRNLNFQYSHDYTYNIHP